MPVYRRSHILISLLEFLLPADFTHLMGDLEEEYLEYKERNGLWKAQVWFWFHILQSTPRFIYESLIWNTLMISNYLKVALRNIKKHKSFSLINIFGLSASISICLLIILFVYDQKSYDGFHEKGDRIYRVTSDFKSSGNLSNHRYATSPAPLSDILKEEYPIVENATTVRRRISGDTRYNEKVLGINGLYTEPAFLDIFSFNLIKGDPVTALKDPGSIILNKETAQKFFGDEDPIGKVLNVIGTGDFTVTGVIDNDRRTHLTFDVLASYSTLLADSEFRTVRIDNWRNSIYTTYTYFVLDEGVSIADLESQMPALIASKFQPREDSYIAEFIIQPLSNINLGPSMDNQLGSVMPPEPIYFLGGFALIIMVIACFNYMGLTIARSLSRSKEVGVRKALGADKRSVIAQFLIEAVVVSVLSLLFATVFLYYLLPQFNGLRFIGSSLERQVSFSFIDDFGLYIGFIGFSIFIGLAAGLFPALHLSSFRSARVLKGIENVQGLSKSYIRKGLLVVQFACSMLFIVTTLVINNQFNHLMNADYGFDKESVINVQLRDVPFERVKDALSSHSDVLEISGASITPGLQSRADMRVSSDFIEGETKANYFAVDENYIHNMGLEIVAGRNFSADITTDVDGSFLISEKMVAQLGFANPADAIGESVMVSDSSYSVIGVIKDFVSSDITREVEPVFMQYSPEFINVANLRVRTGSITNVTSFLEESWPSLGSIYALRYDIFSEQLQNTGSIVILTDVIKVVGLIAFFAIMISCLGLLGMAMFNAESRTKEIGIRKVLGANLEDIVYLLSREYIWLLGLAIVISIPLTYMLNNLLLQEMANRIPLSPITFIIGIGVIIVLAVVTIGSQTLRAARTNSADNLRAE